MSILLPLADLETFLSVPAGTDSALLTAIADAVEEQFLADANRRARPFQDVQNARVEIHDARRSAVLVLDYPITALTSITLGLDPAAPDETLDVSDPTVIQWTAGRRRIQRVDGGLFGPYATTLRGLAFVPPVPPASATAAVPLANYIRVTYNAAADLPTLAKLAIQRAVAMIYRQLGSEDATQERVSTYSRTMAKVYGDDLIWARAVAACWEPRV